MMNNELLLLILKKQKYLNSANEDKTTKKVEFRMNEQVQTFSFNPPIKVVEEGKWLIAVTNFKATNAVFIRTDENNSFSITMPVY